MEQQSITNGGVQTVPEIAVQYVYLDFDGELTSYNGEILTVDNVEVQDSSLTEERIANIVAELNAQYAAQNVIFVTDRSETAEYSTIYIGKTSAFDKYGNFAGLAETIDEGNQIKDDNAFVMLDSTASNEAIIATISHETDHLLGTFDHGGEGLQAYAANTIIGNGVTSTGLTISSGNSVIVSSGGVANSTTVNSGGGMGIYSGGTALAIIENGGYVYDADGAEVTFVTNTFSGLELTSQSATVHSGTTAVATTVNSGGYMHISSGGVANSTMVNDGNMYVSSGGVANSTTVVNSHGRMFISSGGVANSTTVNSGGYMHISSGGVANSTTVRSSGYMYIFSGGVANSTTVNSYGSMHITSGGTATDIVVSSGGRLGIAVASDTYIQGITEGSAFEMKDAVLNEYTINGGWVGVSSGGVANSTTVDSNGNMHIFSGGVANSATVNTNGGMYISSGGTATDIVVSSGGRLGIAVASDTYIQGITEGSAFEMKDAVLNEYTINGGWVGVSSGGAANSTTVNYSRGYMGIFNGGVANSTTVNSGGSMFISSGGVANSTTVNSRGDMGIFNGGVANNTIVGSEGYIVFWEGGSATDLILNTGGKLGGFSFAEDKVFDTITNGSAVISENVFIAERTMHISSGGAANSTTVFSGRMYISSGGVANSTTVNSYGSMHISSGGVANETTVNRYGSMYISSGGAANSTTVFGGRMYISSGGVANSTTVDSNGNMCIFSGGVANSTTVNVGGRMTIYGVANDIIMNHKATVANFTNTGSAAAVIKQVTGNVVTGDLEGGKFSGSITCSGNLSITNTAGSYKLTLQKGKYIVTGNDFSDVTFSIASDMALDFSGNYWGITDIEAIYEKYGFSKEQVTIDNVLFFNVTVTGLKRNTFSRRTESFTVVFSHEFDEKTITLDAFKLTDRDGKTVMINSIEIIDDKTLKLNIATPEVEGRYHLDFSASIKDQSGASLVGMNSAQNNAEWAERITLKADYTAPYVVSVTPEHDFAGTLQQFSITFSDAIDAETLQGNVHLLGPDGNDIALQLQTVANGVASFTMSPQTAYGEYTIVVDEEVTDFAGNKLDQNRNGIDEETGDAYTHSFQITNVDLKVADVTLNKTIFAPGETVTVDWNTFNNGGYVLSGSWTDGIYLSTDTRWDINDIKLGELVHNGGLAKDQQLANTRDVKLTGIAAGNYYILVRSDIYMQEKGDREAADAAQNLQAVEIQVEIPRLDVDKTVSGTLKKNGEFVYYVVHQKANESLNISLNTLEGNIVNDIFVGYDVIPNQTSYDQALRRVTDGNLLVNASVLDRDIYIMLKTRTNSTAQQYSYDLIVQSVPLSISAVSGAMQGNTDNSVFDIRGVDLTPDTKAYLMSADGEKFEAVVSFVNTNRIIATVSAGTLAAGKYTLFISNGEETVQSDSDITIISDAKPEFDITYTMDPYINWNNTATMEITYANTGNAAMDAPLVIIHPYRNDGKDGAFLTFDKSIVKRGFWTSTKPVGFEYSLSFLATGSMPGTLEANSGTQTQKVYYAGWKTPWPSIDITIDWNLSCITSESTEALDWNDVFSNSDYSDSYQQTLVNSFNTSVGNTWGSYVKMLNQNLRYIDSIGGSTDNLSAEDLLCFEVMQNSGEMSPYRNLQSSTDFSLIVPGDLTLAVSRSYDSSLSARDKNSSMGYGWSTNLDIQLEIKVDGDLVFTLGGSSAYYQPDFSGGYQTVAKDGSVMKKSSTGYRLTMTNGVVYDFDKSGKILTATDKYNNSLKYSYDSNGHVSKITHSCGESLTVTRNEDGYVSSVNDTLGNKKTYTYDANGNLIKVEDTISGHGISYTYGNTHNMTSVTGIDGNSSMYTYNEQGLLSSVSTRDGAYKVSIDYGANGEVTLRDTRDANQTYYYDSNGRATKTVDHTSGVTTYFRYDEQGQLIATYDSTGKASGFTYDANGNISSIVDEYGNKTTYINHKNGTVAQMTDVYGNVTEYTYDTNGNLTGTYYADGTCETCTYDNAGNVSSITDANGGVTVYTYDVKGRVTSTEYNGKTTMYSYDANNNLTGITHEDGSTSTYAYNNLNLMTSFTDSKGNVTAFSYDDAGNMTGITYADNSKESFSYNTTGDLTRKTNRRGDSIHYTINAMGDITKVTQSDGTVINYSYDGQGRVISAGDQVYTYNNLDYVTQVSFSDNRKINYIYDNLDRVISISDELGHVTNYTYTQYGEIDTLMNGDGELVVDYDYDKYGRLIKITNGNGTYSTYSYNVYGDVTAIEHYGKDGILTGFNRYTYNADNLVATKETEEGTWNYSYDKVGQLTSAVLKDTSNNVLRSENYTYDAMGNRTKSVIDGVTTTYTYNNMNQIVSANGFAYKYDADGNLLEDEKRTYTWTTDNRVASETDKASGQTWTYTYDALGNRISSTTNGVTTTYTVDANGNVLAEYIDGKWSRSYYHGNSLAGWTDADGEYFFNYDMLGSTGSITAGDGSVTNTYSYDSFGNILSASEGIANDFEFIGAYGLMANDSGTTFVRARNYDAATGRWISADPFGINGGENLYVYCGGDGVNLIDTSGKYPVRHYANSVMNIKSTKKDTAQVIMFSTENMLTGMEYYNKKFNKKEFSFKYGHNNQHFKPSLYGKAAEFVGNTVTVITASCDIVEGINDGGISEGARRSYTQAFKILGGAGGAKVGAVVVAAALPVAAPIGLAVGAVAGAIVVGYFGEKVGEKIGNVLLPPSPPSHSTEPITGSNSGISVSHDPNDKTVTEGHGVKKYVKADSTLNYKVEFENDPEWATAPARWIRVFDVLADEFDPDTFELKSICIAGNYIEVGEGRSSYSETVELDIKGKKILTQISINLEENEDGKTQIFAEFTAIDPETGWMEQDVTTGILFPNDESSCGEGYFTYSIGLKEGVAHGTEVKNKADIYFDFNEVIETPTTVNTIDSVNPVFDGFTAISDGGNQVTFTLNGSDADSGIKGYNISYSTDGENFTFFTTVTGSSWTCEIDLQTEYFFKAQAIDNVGNVSDWSEAITVALPFINITADTETVTNKLAVTATIPENAKSYYSTDMSIWTQFDGTLYLNQNGLYYFKAVGPTNLASNYVTLDVKNIDKIAPDAPVATANTTAPTNQNVTVTVTYSDDSTVKQYKIGDGEWTDYTGAFTVSENAMVYLRAEDAATNESTSELVISNIDKTAPIKPTASANITAATNKNVTVTAKFSSDSKVKQYSLDNKTWKIYSSGVSMTQNGTVYFRGADAAGNYSAVTSYKVSNIDRIAPADGKITLKQTSNTSVSVAISGFTDKGGIARYDVYLAGKKIGSTTSTSYTYKAASQLTGTLKFSVKAVDTSGNVSAGRSASLSAKKFTVLTVVGKATEKTTPLKWDPVTMDEPLRQYEISIAGVKKVYKSKTNSITIKKLAAGNQKFTVYAVDKAKNRKLVVSNEVIHIADITAPKGGRVKLTQKSQNSVQIAISNFKDNMGVKNYEIYLGSTKVGTTSSSTYTYNGKDLGGKLQFNVVAVDAAGNKSKAKKASITIKDATAPTKVTGLKVSGTPDEKASVLTWTPAKDNVGVTQYEIKVSGSTKVYKSKTNSITIKKLTPGKHTFTVTAIDKAKNRSAISASATFTVKDITAPKGGRVKLTQKSQNSVQIAISNFKDNVGVKNYEIYLGSTKVGTTSSSTYTYNGKDLGGKLQFNVVAVDAAGNKSKAKKASITIKDATAPTKVTGLKVSGTPDEKASVLTWTAAKDNVGVTQYEISVSGSTKVYKSKTNSVTIKKLTPGKHTFTVTAIDKAKNRSTVSASAAFTVKDITAPKGGSVKLAQSGNTIKFTISNFKDNVGVKNYEIYLGDKKVGTTSSTAYTYKGALTDGRMQFSVVAVDAAGNKSKAKKASIKVTPVAGKSGDTLTEFLPDSTGFVDLTGWNDQNSGLNASDDIFGGLLPDSDGDMLCSTDLIDLGELTGNTDNAVGAVDLLNDDLKNKGKGFNGTLA